jgi:hypothetical protein
MIRRSLPVLLLSLWILALPAQTAIGAVNSYSKNGNAFTSASGQYATAAHCISGQTCSWVVGDGMVLGVYYSNTSTWTGGTAMWEFQVTDPLPSIQAAEVRIERPAAYGKGLHSPSLEGNAMVSVDELENVIANPAVREEYRCPGDYYAHACGATHLTFPVPVESIGAITRVHVAADDLTAWDISRVVLTVSSADPQGISIFNGKLWVDGLPYPLRGVDYAPWLQGTGPEPYHQPFPNEFEDVTALVAANQRRWVPDYSGDGRIQAWEVIRYDVEVMAAAGINTIRTYASGGWHDRNLNGIQESGETAQGDLPDWVYDRLLPYAADNGMRVIIGYWVQEEDFDASMVCNWADLEVAKQAFGRVVQKYKTHPAVLAWGVGNEVHLPPALGRQWFTWGVDINAYLNALNAYVRTLDTAHPVMYARYVGENAEFLNLTADIIAVNAYIHPAAELVSLGEFDPAPPAGKAYLLGEFGHILGQAADHWTLAQQHAGGCFLEFNNVWWKGDNQDGLGIVDQYRHVNPDRFSELTALYQGPGLDLCLEDRDVDGDVDGSDLHLFMGGSGGSGPVLQSFAIEFGRAACP